jgi:hypothetical protein
MPIRFNPLKQKEIERSERGGWNSERRYILLGEKREKMFRA